MVERKLMRIAETDTVTKSESFIFTGRMAEIVEYRVEFDDLVRVENVGEGCIPGEPMAVL